ncbi:hypothetical protein NDU88_004324 [Pleurodeles waltl]|uniref:Uncharacterized protein n=1 Tax=Pleurodeles waltl TaxID=8319 RepID=A0AAV7NTE1_PLEWA|nr:hypothetical protein NDU88_004324 [Pleurodeles waltl]
MRDWREERQRVWRRLWQPARRHVVMQTGRLSCVRQGELRGTEQHVALMWYEDFQAGQSIDMSRGIVESKKDKVYGEHGLEREEGPALALVAALLEWSEDEWHCRPPKNVYTRGSGIKKAVGKAKKAGVARHGVPKSSRMYEDEIV